MLILKIFAHEIILTTHHIFIDVMSTLSLVLYQLLSNLSQNCKHMCNAQTINLGVLLLSTL